MASTRYTNLNFIEPLVPKHHSPAFSHRPFILDDTISAPWVDLDVLHGSGLLADVGSHHPH